ncbi:MAG: TrkH family potassium uptake protein [Spirochaetota bacterium]
MKRIFASEHTILFSYFIALILIGTVLLYIPAAWGGPDRLHAVDALFTAVSAVCVTGLITVDTAQYTLFGQTVILLLIQFGGLGIITFTTVIFLSSSRSKKISFTNMRMVKKFYVDSIENKAHHMLRNILLLTIGAEIIGTVLLWLRFRQTVPAGAVFHSIFHAVSAFCNAGFSLFSDSLEGYAADPLVLIVVMLLILVGGLGFLVIHDVMQVLRGQRKRLSLHTRIVFGATALLLITGALLYFLLERERSLQGMGPGSKLMNAIFQSVTPRTAGFNTIDQSSMTGSAKFVTIVLMFIGGSPASIAGGIKTTTFFIVFMAIFRDIDWTGRIRIRDRMISSAQVSRAMLFLGKAVGLLGASIFLLTITEMLNNPSLDFFTVIFESVSAFGTVGLSTGLTPNLTAAGKFIIILTMFAGRVGLISLIIPLFRDKREHTVDYPEEEVLIG